MKPLPEEKESTEKSSLNNQKQTFDMHAPDINATIADLIESIREDVQRTLEKKAQKHGQHKKK